MRDYIIRRLFLNIPVLAIVLVLIFSIIRLVPGDVVEVMLADVGGSPEVRAQAYEQIQHDLGLDQPIHVQFATYLKGLVKGDLGNSIWSKQSVMSEILSRLPVTIELGVIAVLISASLALPLGIVAAVRQDTWVDYVTRVFSVLALSVPSFWTATLIVVFPAIWWHYAPPMEYQAPWQDLFGNLRQILVPAVILGLVLMGSVSRMTRSALLEVIRQDYIRTAAAKGLRERVVLWRHALKNAMIPVITLMGLQLGIVIGGTVVMETVFGLPGVGKLVVDAINKRDFPQLQGNVLFIAMWILLVNLLVDLAYAWLDPRIRYH